MSISIFAPLLYLLIGLGLGRFSFSIKEKASALLTQWVIPFVIIYNIATNQADIFVIMIGMICMMTLMLSLSRIFTKDPVKNLSFCYLNIGWLGLPIASSLFGDEAATVIIAAYVGSSLFGNSIGVSLMVKGQNLRNRIFQTLKAPPVLALLLGILCIPLGAQFEHYFTSVYNVLKFLMSFLGMSILGIWLSINPPKISNIKKELIFFGARILTIWVLLSLFILICQHYSITLITENKSVLYLIGCLPPAANIIVLETHYMRTGHSAGMIAFNTSISMIAIIVYVSAVLWLPLFLPLNTIL